MARRAKYSKADLDAQVAAQQPLTETDSKILARLIGKYGAEAIRAAIDTVGPPAPRGRPSKGHLPYYEAMHLADWFEEAIEEHRQNGSTTPVRDAENELYEIARGPRVPGDEAVFEAWRRNTKNKRLKGRRDLIDVKAKLDTSRSAAKRHK